VTSGAFASNAYFCETPVPGGCILIDAGLDGPAIDAALAEHGLRPHQVHCTHGHFDHAGSAAYFQKKYGCRVFMHPDDMRTLKASNFLLMAFKMAQRIELPDITPVGPEFCLDVGGQPLIYHATPGHTPGSCVIEFGSAWFTGDTLYSRGVGLSRLPGENAHDLKQSILGLWSQLTAERTLCPGHGEAADGASIRRENLALLNFLGLSQDGGDAA
jgi:glyoxylase-like metal-dependent hydrolase (beta-lactamase superfamily II)